MLHMMNELKAKKENSKENKEMWCTNCKVEDHTKTTRPKKLFCGIC